MQEEISLSEFEVLGLHGDRNINITFTSPIKILVDENGAGKTTILNMLVNILQGNILRLTKYDFDRIVITFSNEEKIEFLREEINGSVSKSSNPLINDIISKFSVNLAERLVFDILNLSYSELRRQKSGFLERVSSEVGVSPRAIYEIVRQGLRSTPKSDFFNNQTSFKDLEDTEVTIGDKVDKIKRLFPYKILYLPTYRLVEENLQDLGYPQDKFPESTSALIQFGMRDVRKKWDNLTDDIRRSSVQWLSRVSGNMLDELTEGIKGDAIDYESINNSKDVMRIVLDRSGENISPSKKYRILGLVESGDIRRSEYEPLAYFLSKLVQIYEQQQTKDDTIKNFVRVINSYLDDKEIVYNESELDIRLFNKRTKQRMSLDKLSSGEKQIVSIFTRLYFKESVELPFAIFFDEPELSLSMEWQKKLLQDIVDSDQCVFLLVATHSPFTFENNLARNADVLHIEFVENENE